jgi:hypothetical protein
LDRAGKRHPPQGSGPSPGLGHAIAELSALIGEQAQYIVFILV